MEHAVQQPLDEMKAYVGFDDDDVAHLRALWPGVRPRIDAVIDHFYARILAFEGAHQVLADASQVERLKRTLHVWLEELLTHPRDADYAERRQRIGRRHVEVGLESRYMFTAMAVIADDLLEIVYETAPSPQAAAAISRSLQRACTLDLALMTGTFVTSRERGQLAALQELLVYHLRVTVLLVDAEGRVSAATRPTQRLFGGPSTTGGSWVDAVPDDLRRAAGLESQVARALQTNREISMPRVDVGERPDTRSFSVHIVPLDHALARFLLQIEDLTDAVHLEGRLRRAEALAQLGSLSAAVAHELRNPLAGISGAIQVIGAAVPDDAPHKPIMERVEQEIHRLDGLVSDLLAFARQGAVAVRRTDLREPCEAAVALVRTDQPTLDVTIVGTGHAVADANLVQQIVLNLVQNAVQANPTPPRIEIRIDGPRIVVSDDGPGVAPERAEEIFQPFFTTRTRGTGLGLAISRRSAQAMSGDLTLGKDGPLPGATFVLDLPSAAETS